MPTKNDSTDKSTFIDNVATLISSRIAFADSVKQNYGFACVKLDSGAVISGICELEFVGTERGATVVATLDSKTGKWRVW